MLDKIWFWIFCKLTYNFWFVKLYFKYLEKCEQNSNTNQNTIPDTGEELMQTNVCCDDKYILDGNISSWLSFWELQFNVTAWSFLNYHFMPAVIGKCMWVTSIQRRSRLRSLATPSDEAFCLLVLKNGCDL